MNVPHIETKCPSNLETSVVFCNPNSVINIVKDDLIILDWVPNIHQSRFGLGVHNICCENDIKLYKSLSAPITIFTSTDPFSGNKLYSIIADTDSLPKDKKWIRFCGIALSNVFFYPKLIHSFQ